MASGMTAEVKDEPRSWTHGLSRFASYRSGAEEASPCYVREAWQRTHLETRGKYLIVNRLRCSRVSTEELQPGMRAFAAHFRVDELVGQQRPDSTD